MLTFKTDFIKYRSLCFRAMQARLQDLQSRRIAAVVSAVGSGCLEFRNESHRTHAVLTKDASQPGNWRTSFYYERGFSGHESYKSRVEAIENMARDGYTVPAPGSLDRFASTVEWDEGTRACALVRILNELAARGLYALRRSVEVYFDRQGQTWDALEEIQGWMPTMRTKTVPAKLWSLQDDFMQDELIGELA